MTSALSLSGVWLPPGIFREQNNAMLAAMLVMEPLEKGML